MKIVLNNDLWGGDPGLNVGFFQIFALAERDNINFLIYLTTFFNCSDFMLMKERMALNDEFSKKRSLTVLRNCPSVWRGNKLSSIKDYLQLCSFIPVGRTRLGATLRYCDNTWPSNELRTDLWVI